MSDTLEIKKVRVVVGVPLIPVGHLSKLPIFVCFMSYRMARETTDESSRASAFNCIELF